MTIASYINYATFSAMAVPAMLSWPGVTRVTFIPDGDAVSVLVNYGEAGASLTRITQAELSSSDNPWKLIECLWMDVTGGNKEWKVASPYLLDVKDAK